MKGILALLLGAVIGTSSCASMEKMTEIVKFRSQKPNLELKLNQRLDQRVQHKPLSEIREEELSEYQYFEHETHYDFDYGSLQTQFTVYIRPNGKFLTHTNVSGLDGNKNKLLEEILNQNHSLSLEKQIQGLNTIKDNMNGVVSEEEAEQIVNDIKSVLVEYQIWVNNQHQAHGLIKREVLEETGVLVDSLKEFDNYLSQTLGEDRFFQDFENTRKDFFEKANELGDSANRLKRLSKLECFDLLNSVLDENFNWDGYNCNQLAQTYRNYFTFLKGINPNLKGVHVTPGSAWRLEVGRGQEGHSLIRVYDLTNSTTLFIDTSKIANGDYSGGVDDVYVFKLDRMVARK